MTETASLIVVGMPLLVLGAVLYLCAQEFVLWRSHRGTTQALGSAWCLTAGLFLASRVVQRALYTSDAAVCASVYGQFAASVLLLPLSILVARALGGLVNSRRLVGRLAVATLFVLVLVLGFAIHRDLYVRIDLLGQPLRAAPVGPTVLVLPPLVAATIGYVMRVMRISRADGRRDPMHVVAAFIMGALLLNDALLAAGVLRTIQLAHVGLVIAMLAAGTMQTSSIYGRQKLLGEAVEDRTRALEQALANLRREESRYRLLAGATVEGILVHERGKVVDANESATRLFGYDSASLKGSDVLSLFAPEAKAALEKVLDGGTDAPLKTIGRRPDGKTLSLEVSAKRGLSNDRDVHLMAVRDTTERDEIERRLVVADRMASLGTLAAGAAHEVNNPLTYAMLNLDMLEERLRRLEASAPRPLLEQLRAHASNAMDGCDRVARVIADLRTLSREQEKPRGPVDLRLVAQAAVKMARNEIRYRARLVESYDGRPVVLADEARLAQVCLNLLINAAHAIPVGHADANEIRIATRVEGGAAILEVADTGAGIASDALPRIFDPFFTTKPVGAGTGLGLSICHGIVSGLGGQIAVETREGAGTIFRVSLPAATVEHVASPGRMLAARPVAVPRGRILIVDDEPALARIMGEGLEQCEVTIAANGRDAIARLDKGAFDLVLCDVMMPQTNGIEVLEYVLTAKPDLLPSFVLMTGGALSEPVSDFLQKTATRCLDKPISMDALRRIVDEILRHSSPRQQPAAAPSPALADSAPASEPSHG